jgi:hypothetical protein
MTAIHETAYPRIRSNVTDKELCELYTPTEEEKDFADGNTRGKVPKLGLLVLVKMFQRLGYFPMLDTIPQRVIRHIAKSSGLEDVIEDLQSYEETGSRLKHLPKIRQWLDIKEFRSDGPQVINDALEKACQTKDIIADIINVGIEELIRERYELPAFSALLRAATRARSHVNNGFYQSVFSALCESQKQIICGLLQRKPTDLQSGWHRLKLEPKKATSKNMRQFIDQLHWLVSLNGFRHLLSSVPEAKLQRFASEACSLNVAQMNEMEAKKRFTLAVALIRTQTALAIDDLTEMFLRSAAKLHNRGKQALDEYHQHHREKTENLIFVLSDILSVLDESTPATQQIEAITDIVGDDGGWKKCVS